MKAKPSHKDMIKEQQKLTSLPSDNYLMSLKIAQQLQGQSEDSNKQSSFDENNKNWVSGGKTVK